VRPFRSVAAAGVLALLPFPPLAGTEDASAAAEAIAEADRLWAARGDGATGGEALPSRIDPVIAACVQAIGLDPDSLEPRWRLMRALYFKGEYTTRDPDEKKRIFGEGKRAGDEALAVLGKKVAAGTGRSTEKDNPVELAPAAKAIRGAAPTFLWAGVDWGKWALVYGKVAAAKKGAAAKIRDDAEAVIIIDPSYDDGAGYRLLGRLHHQTPRIPFVTFWASRSEALKNLKLALEAGPENFYNRLYWAEALWDYESSRRDEARKALEALVAATPSPAYIVEDRRAQEEARELLRSWGR
jgi:tetratricopeptide (TPR) repeat protein